MNKQIGFKSMPLLLKTIWIISLLFILFSFISILKGFEYGILFFGFYVEGLSHISLVLILDILAPLIFLFGTWYRKKFAIKVAFTYMSIFIISKIYSLLFLRDILGFVLIDILLYILISLLITSFLIIIYKERNYFKY